MTNRRKRESERGDRSAHRTAQVSPFDRNAVNLGFDVGEHDDSQTDL